VQELVTCFKVVLQYSFQGSEDDHEKAQLEQKPWEGLEPGFQKARKAQYKTRSGTG